MTRIIDTNVDISGWIDELVKAGVSTVIRYYSQNKAKRLGPAEAQALAEAELSVVTIYQDRNGGGKPGGDIADLAPARGTADAQRALQQAAAVGQPAGSTIYFAVDWDFVNKAQLAQITGYFEAARAELDGQYKLGIYGSGLVTKVVHKAGLVEHVWLAQSTGWTGYKEALAGNYVSLIQLTERIWPGAQFSYDENMLAPGVTDIGAFVPGGAPVQLALPMRRALFSVNARSGLNLRRGPGTEFDVVRTLPAGTVVHGLGQQGNWLLADGEGDGLADGFLATAFLKPLAGSLSAPAPTGLTPYEIAKLELARGVCEISGSARNARIAEYHASTGYTAYTENDAWCSSFVNWCVEQAGLKGTDSPTALSWHNAKWGEDVTDAPEPGDIAVFARGSSGYGHVGFLVAAAGDTLSILGGNQGNCVSVQSYPKHGKVGGEIFELRSIRRPPRP